MFASPKLSIDSKNKSATTDTDSQQPTPNNRHQTTSNQKQQAATTPDNQQPAPGMLRPAACNQQQLLTTTPDRSQNPTTDTRQPPISCDNHSDARLSPKPMTDTRQPAISCDNDTRQIPKPKDQHLTTDNLQYHVTIIAMPDIHKPTTESHSYTATNR